MQTFRKDEVEAGSETALHLSLAVARDFVHVNIVSREDKL